MRGPEGKWVTKYSGLKEVKGRSDQSRRQMEVIGGVLFKKGTTAMPSPLTATDEGYNGRTR